MEDNSRASAPDQASYDGILAYFREVLPAQKEIDKYLIEILSYKYFNRYDLSDNDKDEYIDKLSSDLERNIVIVDYEPKTRIFAELMVIGPETQRDPEADSVTRVMEAVYALRKDYARTKERPTSFSERVSKPKYKPRPRGRPSEKTVGKFLAPSEHLERYYSKEIAAGQLVASDLRRLDKTLYNALNYEAQQEGKSLSDYLPLKNDRHEIMRRHLATILDTSVDDAARYFGAARRTYEVSSER